MLGHDDIVFCTNDTLGACQWIELIAKQYTRAACVQSSRKTFTACVAAHWYETVVCLRHKVLSVSRQS